MDDRKLKILSAVVDEYIVSGEPVGSKAIMAHVKASSATIRNEMAELEKQGYLEQPHTSAGRVPTYKGYRLYVDKLMEQNPLSEEEKNKLDSMLPDDFVTEKDLVESASLALAELTKCATVVANSTPKFSLISKVEVIPTGKRMYVILMITSNGEIKNKVCRLEFDLTNEQLEFFDNFVKQNLNGVPISEISDANMEKLTEAMGAYMMTLSPLVSEVLKMTKELDRSVSLNGQKNLLTCKDLDQTEIISFLDNEKELMAFIDSTFSGLNVMFSPENDGFVIHNSSMITAPFSKDGQMAGALGLIGPMRIDYAKFIPYLEYFTSRITDLISERDDDDNND
ncbi:heat-inducible transcriptional repressor HrcA [Ruminococcus albus]|jgi:heat-inducible transcriptional repressor|uniref:Heat-inducible transcription repressor HrcA n=1 Tax=Ruminococcus albus SY3 TaxID=1341156 RepID=A0A011WL04_RUMAL|nr:heat-inducible transcriptional repressor HrcA [Ruminococcus albus]EXM37720.1 HrcA family transcriptional regulator [Ruminococcus albus SY3]MBE6868556.1 heat-inducible transcription repressor HrcA [Ruminococcus albus]